MHARRPLLQTLLIACALAAHAAPAAAQTTAGQLALDPLEPTPTGDMLLAVPSPRIGGHLVPRGALLFEYARDSLRLFIGDREAALVSAQGILRADVSFALWDRLLLSAHFPVALFQSGQDPAIPGVPVRPPEGAAAGDLRLGARGRILGRSDRDIFQLGLDGYLFAPTAPASEYMGDGVVRGELRLLLGGRIGFVAWSADGGVHLRGSSNPHALRFGAGAAALLLGDRLTLGLQAHGGYPFGETVLLSTPDTSITSTPRLGLELLGEARMRFFAGLTAGVAAGPGLLAGLGTPTVRVLVLAGWSPPATTRRDTPAGPKPGDRDGDGFRDDVDACPDEKGEFAGDPNKDGCPPPDHDKDGVLDVDDACPLIAGDPSTTPGKNGCPRDSDGDGIADRDDACPADKGLAGENPKKRGCPKDGDGDGVFDSVDSCPDAAGIAAPDPAQHGCPADADGDGIDYPADVCPRERGPADAERKGCPRFIRIEGDTILTDKRVELAPSFRAQGLAVTAESMPVLEEIRELLKDHPEITKLEVQGHTDDAGDVKKKLELSQEEADIVRQAMVDIGIPAEKLVARGYGHKKPIADNRIPEGRLQNHRIGFEIIERAK